jgi:heptaprenyl diphosphate synthase
MRYSTYDLTRWSILTALALALSVSESLFFPSALFPVPGMRLGLANIVTLLAIYMFGAIPTMLIVLIRCLITFAFGGNLTAFLFSLAGGMLALVVMLLLRNSKIFSLFGVSMGGAAAHTVGQILIAAVLVRSLYVLTYLPVLLLVSIITGLLVAALSIPVYKAVGKLRPGALS